MAQCARCVPTEGPNAALCQPMPLSQLTNPTIATVPDPLAIRQAEHASKSCVDLDHTQIFFCSPSSSVGYRNWLCCARHSCPSNIYKTLGRPIASFGSHRIWNEISVLELDDNILDYLLHLAHTLNQDYCSTNRSRIVQHGNNRLGYIDKAILEMHELDFCLGRSHARFSKLHCTPENRK